MGIDRIGKGGAAPPAPDAEGAGKLDKAGKAGAVDKPFQVERAKDATPVERVDAASETSPLARLKAGEIDVEQYLDLHVDEATSALEGLPPADLQDIKKMLRDQLATDPGFVDLVRSATGKVPTPPDE